MGCCSFRSLLLAVVVLCNCISWTASRHHFSHNVLGHRSRHRRQGAGLFLSSSYVLPGGEGSGAWGPWGEVSPCSRSCGGGVASQKRICLEIGSDGLPLCQGGDTKYFSCQTQDCPDHADYRVQQCANFNDVPFKGNRYDWVPYTKAPNVCELNCMPRGGRFYYRQKEKVVDGTRCNEDGFDVCVDGTCQPVGCDMMLGSYATEDKCRECRGNGSNCHTVSGSIDSQDLRQGYNDVLLIPQGATSINIAERRTSNNYLALRSKQSNVYYLNGDYQIDFPRTRHIAGALWRYERSSDGLPSPDKLKCQGPTNEPLYLSLLLQDVNVGIDYEYSVPTALAPPPNQQYNWVFDEFTPCSATCGGGYQQRNVTCRSREELEVVDESLCDIGLKPVSNQTCSTQSCAARWVEGSWRPCSKPCGQGGTRFRSVHCEKIITNGYPSIVDDQECFNLLGPKPSLYEECNVNASCPTWFTGPWKPCNKLCGEGKQTRQVVCHQKLNGKVEVLSEDQCADEKPPAEKDCYLHPCEGVDWVISDWSGCDNCLSKVRTRSAECATKDRKVVNSSLCSYHPLPSLEEDCDRTKLPPCTVQWYATQWSNCSVQCGKGVQSRRVFCGLFDGSAVVKVDDDRCESEDKYKDEKPCEVPEDKCPAKWFGGPWSACTKECGGGEQFRRVMCLSGGKEASDCDENTVLDYTQSCNTGPCDKDETIPVDSSSTPIMDEDYDEECPDDEEEEKEIEEGAEEEEGSTATTIELMFSDSPSTTEEGSGETETDIIFSSSSTSETAEGSGSEPTEAGTEATSETSTDATSSTESAATGETSESSTEVAGTGSTDVSGIASVSEASESTSESNRASTSESETSTTESSTDASSTESSIETSETESGHTTSSDASTTEAGATESSTEEISDGSTTERGHTISTTEEISDGTTTERGYTKSTTESGSSDSGTEETGSTVTEETGSTATEETGSTVTEETGSTTTEETGSTATEETGSTATEETGSTVTEETGSTVTEGTESTGTEGTGSTETSDLDTGSTESGATEETGTTESGATEETGSTESTSESSTSETEEETEGTSETTPWDWSSTIEEITRKSRCKPKKRPAKCVKSEFGCCPDKRTPAAGPFDEGSTVTEETGSTVTEGTESTGTEGTGSTETSDLDTGSTESGATEETGTTESGATEETGSTESTSESSTSETEEETEGTSETTPWDWSSTIEEITRKSRCKPKKRPAKCVKSEFGCCPDKRTPAAGPFDEGCPNPQTCKESKYGCCPDGVSPSGPKPSDCPVPPCNETLYGCCKSDNKTAAEGNDQEGCPPPPPKCKSSKFGCCKDGKTEAKGPKKKGCPENEPKKEPKGCAATKFGCCYDNVTEATGPDGDGCPCPPDGMTPAGVRLKGCVLSCNTSAYGCCPDGETPAHGPDAEGCCLQYSFGCCPDNYKPAEGPDLEGCGCQYAHYGCCPDNATIARGPRNEGCGCQFTEHGCCPDRHTEAAGPNNEGCACHTYQFGCCPDGVTVAKGPSLQGCLCSQSEHGCCGDGVTPAKGQDLAGCDCGSSKYGCCPDGQTEAKGEKFLGCTDIPENRQAACSLKFDRGTCRNYTVNWYYDLEYGGCSRFYYGGCDGNGNRFASQAECEDVCVHPPPKSACNLPKVKGACQGYYLRWYFDSARETCGQFIFGGCLGNSNNFENREACQAQCEPARSENQCKLPIERGSCAGNFSRWGFSVEAGRCEQFMWGGCEGNANRFASEAACVQRCDPPGALKPACTLTQVTGNCTEKLARWAFSQTDNRCVPFYYTSCNANENNFQTEEECSANCPSAYMKDTCTLPAETGDCADYRQRWYYDTTEQRCRQFYFGGCGGNNNNFVTEQECEHRCTQQQAATTTTTTVAPVDDGPFRQEYCFLEKDHGPCSQSERRWAYDSANGACAPFEYGGCGGNRNNFPSQEYCNYYCAPTQDICQLPMSSGPCSDSQMRWFYDAASDSCSQFTYGGCEGNENRFGSRDECERRCITGPAPTTTTTTVLPVINVRGPELDADPCNQTPDPGLCQGYFVSWYYDAGRDMCGQFVYGGCGGNSNRFDSREQCEGQCRRRLQVTPTAVVTTPSSEVVDPECQTPDSLAPCGPNATAYYYDASRRECLEAQFGGCRYANSWRTVEECERRCGAFRGFDVCRQSNDPGPCTDSQPKFYFDAATGQCQPFTYGGCHGGANRFSTFDECEEVCASGGPDTGNEVLPDCDRFNAECESLRCEHGVVRVRAADGCERCVCAQGGCDDARRECDALKCAYGVDKAVGSDGCERCTCIDHPCSAKECPYGERCVADGYRDPVTQEARYNASCRTVNKPGYCPADDLSQSPDEQCRRECNDDADCREDNKCCARGCSMLCLSGSAPATAAPTTAFVPELPQAPQASSETEPAVTSEEGGKAMLRCLFHSNPPPTITWRRGELTIDGDVGRYRLLSDGALEIVSLYRNDSGVYICVADNGLGVARQEVHLQVNDPVLRPAGISGDEGAIVVGELGQPLAIRCLAYGYPAPTTTWYRGPSGPMVPFISPQYQTRENVLQIVSLDVGTLGEYTCSAYNGHGKPASWSVTVQAYRPDGSYYESPYLLEKGTVYVTPKSPYVEPTVPEQEPEVRGYTVPVSTRLVVSSNSYEAGGELSLPCEVDGYPVPAVRWSRDGAPLPLDDRIDATDARLTISQLTVNDSGVYGCHAANAYGSHYSTVQINVQETAIPSSCTDNPFFAKCSLIVRSKYCRHVYYSQFCCKSCMEAGELQLAELREYQARWSRK